MNSLTYEEALAQVKAQVSASRTTFHAGMAILPKARREGMYALYGFCRTVDDIADESPSPQVAAHGLQEWRAKIAEAFRGNAFDAVTTALLPAIRGFHLDQKDFQDIIDGMEMDSVAIVAPDMPTLDLYCDRVASAVGRASVRIFGSDSEEAMKVAYHLGRALQLTNILRDLAEDAVRGRLYLPRELLEKHGVTEREPQKVLESPKLALICHDLAELAQKHYDDADSYMRLCARATMRPARIMRAYYGAIFERLCASDWQDLRHRVTLSTWEKLLLVSRELIA